MLFALKQSVHTALKKGEQSTLRDLKFEASHCHLKLQIGNHPPRTSSNPDFFIYIFEANTSN
jgi:hypothetical protein